MLTDIKSSSMRVALQQIYVNLFVEYGMNWPGDRQSVEYYLNWSLLCPELQLWKILYPQQSIPVAWVSTTNFLSSHLSNLWYGNSRDTIKFFILKGVGQLTYLFRPKSSHERHIPTSTQFQPPLT